MKLYCRCCNGKLNDFPILKFDNMPKSAQNFPEKEELSCESGIEVKIHQCSYCGLIQIPGNPVSYFRDVIRATSVSDEMKTFRIKQFMEFIKKYKLCKKRIIEIGSGSGEYMEFLKSTDVLVYGIEHNKDSVNKASKKELKVFEGFIEQEDTTIPNAPFDAFYTMNYLEHIPNPRSFLRGIYNNLVEDAVGIIEVPNADMLIEKKLFSEFISDHLMYFTKDTLKIFLESNGFIVLECKTIWYDYILSTTVQKRRMLDVSGFLTQKKNRKQMVDLFFEEHIKLGHNVATWGAGHQALADLSLLDISDKVKFVVDSAKFKQNKYTPATHLPIVAPEEIRKSNIKAILVMAAGFSDEIMKIIKQNYPEVQVAILRENGVERFYD